MVNIYFLALTFTLSVNGCSWVFKILKACFKMAKFIVGNFVMAMNWLVLEVHTYIVNGQ